MSSVGGQEAEAEAASTSSDEPPEISEEQMGQGSELDAEARACWDKKEQEKSAAKAQEAADRAAKHQLAADEKREQNACSGVEAAAEASPASPGFTEFGFPALAKIDGLFDFLLPSALRPCRAPEGSEEWWAHCRQLEAELHARCLKDKEEYRAREAQRVAAKVAKKPKAELTKGKKKQ